MKNNGQIADAQNERILIIVNPCAGRMRGRKYAQWMEQYLQQNGVQVTALETTNEENGEKYAAEAEEAGFTRIVCIGGDGTLNAAINGVLTSGNVLPISYVPAGTTNDFAQTLHLPKRLSTLRAVMKTGRDVHIDAGCMNGRFFSYVASFGAFTKCSYATPRGMKHLLGHLAYVLEGVRDLAALQAYPLRVETDDAVFEDDYVFGAFSNTVSIGGTLKYKETDVDMNDGKLEMLLIRKPASLAEINRLLHALNTRDFTDPLFDFASASRFSLRCPEAMHWSVDGEYEAGSQNTEIRCIQSAVQITVPAEKD